MLVGACRESSIASFSFSFSPCTEILIFSSLIHADYRMCAIVVSQSGCGRSNFSLMLAGRRGLANLLRDPLVYVVMNGSRES